ncbi:hypothetical protein [Sphingomonas sp. Y38-1Y]|uniref:hypothetical protein n=1 Tax=Sphingomonas sp. Y38-1Y TaxID=3078265 RepID=UPI0028ED9FF5|nr:hypothetical protein [Sphingomonas sp. Y38-1Y]
MFDREAVAVTRRYRSDVFGDDPHEPQLVLTMQNRREAGMGLPIPSGQVTVFAAGAARPILVGEAELDDKAEGEKVEVVLPATPDVTAATETAPLKRGARRTTLTVTNATRQPIEHEARIALADGERPRGLVREDGRWIARLRVPANASASVSWTVRPRGPDRRRD